MPAPAPAPRSPRRPRRSSRAALGPRRRPRSPRGRRVHGSVAPAPAEWSPTSLLLIGATEAPLAVRKWGFRPTRRRHSSSVWRTPTTTWTPPTREPNGAARKCSQLPRQALRIRFLRRRRAGTPTRGRNRDRRRPGLGMPRRRTRSLRRTRWCPPQRDRGCDILRASGCAGLSRFAKRVRGRGRSTGIRTTMRCIGITTRHRSGSTGP
mmetsp:Transcript_94944/g.305637  ORF Transcript_94944/g.305637 Transcript_94944/m.305637 type:complete len:208 (-) Transcript_94944:140-763(-)